jgi:hypothetical protein
MLSTRRRRSFSMGRTSPCEWANTVQ